jgi:hypothetical protein
VTSASSAVAPSPRRGRSKLVISIT